MKIIPVIDLKNNLVVFAQQGQRDNYQPINSKICRSSNFLDVIKSFLEIYDFPCFYIADLDAIERHSDHDALILQAITQFPDKQFWLDQGRLESQINTIADNIIPVLGTESLTADNYQQLHEFHKPFVLSLDFASNGMKMGSSKIFSDPQLWPETVIIMTLANVGVQSGPDFQKLQHYRSQFIDKVIVAAGGIRTADDLLQLQKQGINHALIASALHCGAITTKDIQKIWD